MNRSFNGVYLMLVGNSSAPRQSRALKPIVDTPPKRQDRIRFPTELLMAQIRKAAEPAATMLKTAMSKRKKRKIHRLVTFLLLTFFRLNGGLGISLTEEEFAS